MLAATVIVALALGAGCNLLGPSALPSGRFDMKLLGQDPTAAARDYVRRTPAHGIQPDEVLRAVFIGGSNAEVQLVQQFRRIRVLGGVLVLLVDSRSGEVLNVLTDDWQHIDPSTSIVPTLTPEQAREAALMAWPVASPEDSRGDSSSLQLIAPTYVPGLDAVRLAWGTHLRNWQLQPPGHWLVYVDARTGAVLYVSRNLTNLADVTAKTG